MTEANPKIITRSEVDSKNPCPRCGEYQWFQVLKYMSKTGKTYYEVVQCYACLFVHAYHWRVHYGPLKKLKKRTFHELETKQD
jgi:hypothetical protein